MFLWCLCTFTYLHFHQRCLLFQSFNLDLLWPKLKEQKELVPLLCWLLTCVTCSRILCSQRACQAGQNLIDCVLVETKYRMNPVKLFDMQVILWELCSLCPLGKACLSWTWFYPVSERWSVCLFVYLLPTTVAFPPQLSMDLCLGGSEFVKLIALEKWFIIRFSIPKWESFPFQWIVEQKRKGENHSV